MKIYTRQGDRGQTCLFDGRRVPKDDLRIETYGTVDELSSVVGLAICACQAEDLRALLQRVQVDLFALGADLATPAGSPNEAKVTRVSPAQADGLEREIDRMQAGLPALRRFVLPGGTEAAARLHVARTVCRRAERLLVRLMTAEPVGEATLVYLNRLSDLLFVAARWANHQAGQADVEWVPGAPAE
jgi:cob(I)alamin adenosyltransferase